ncbi:aminotransferase class V-fold PLP-dependent enzyme [Microlunatus flavus]|uniref:Selenocysteine lyase/Cysteine desulfurase n=1 Tax=Microlunatus flavus TaxID=1036181 RepID=A0A1H9N738_9ACTN|nr:aminotransferase class V-fold PLP-dependent enzyme [Microlunatus flavus]SER31850.1 Selenocysteine lyase/Cysteine desulfurase [Microlunatus flavus]
MSVLIRPAVPTSRPAAAAAVPPLLPTVGAGWVVPLVGGRQARSVHLDVAASAPALQRVADHVAAALPAYASVHRGAGYLSQLSTALYEQARQTVGAFVSARADDVVVFTRNTTDALNLLAGAVPGDVVVLDVEHHANLLPWRSPRRPYGARVVRSASTLAATEALLAAELAREPAALLAVTGASNVTGEVPDLRRLADLAHAAGARLAVDAAQLLPHRGFDLTATGADYVAFSGHKVYAPYGVGALVGRRDWLDAAEPHLAGGGAVREVTMTDGGASTTWARSPERHEGGTPAVLGALALAEALRALAETGVDRVRAHEAALRARLVGGLRERGVEPVRIWSDAPDAVGVVSFAVPGWRSAQVAAYLSAEHGIGVRDGRFCAHPLLARLGVAAGDGLVRASLGVGSSSADVDRLLGALDQLLADGPRWTYAADGGSCRPSPDDRPAPAWSALASLADLDAGSVPASPCTVPSTGADR